MFHEWNPLLIHLIGRVLNRNVGGHLTPVHPIPLALSHPPPPPSATLPPARAPEVAPAATLGSVPPRQPRLAKSCRSLIR